MNFFDPEGKLVSFVTKVGELILLNLIWLLTCIPIVTIVPATTSFYYAVIKSIRRDRGTPIREYFKSFKRVLLKGIIIELILGVWVIALLFGRNYFLMTGSNEGFNLLQFMYDFLLGFTAVYTLYLIPAFSRFEMSIFKLFKLNFVMVIRFIYLSIPLAIMVAASIYLMIRFIPWVLICLFPGFIVFVSTFLVEPALVKYTPAPTEEEDAWYLPESKKKK